MKKTLATILLALGATGAACAACAVSASECDNCTIKYVGLGPLYSGMCVSESCAVVKVNGDIADKPECSQSGWNYVIDTSTSIGQDALKVVLQAKTHNLPITVGGSGKCTTWEQSEDFHYGVLVD